MKRALTIAGSDSGGGAGIQADLKTFCTFGVYGMTAVTSVTAQNTREVRAIYDLEPVMVRKQIEAVCEDIGVDAAKTVMLSNADIIVMVAQAIQQYRIEKLVVDPVMVAKSGDVLLRPGALTALEHDLLPLTWIITPNLPEAELLSGITVSSPAEMKEAARIIRNKGPRYVLIKGGHLPGDRMVDLLYDGEKWVEYPVTRILTKNTHGTGCTYSAALCALLALGYGMEEAVKVAREYMDTVIQHALPLGQGYGPTNHLAPFFLKAGMDPREGGRVW
ncbi:MAG: bifunctional hydroxymethylpyrimidine kinase/phosphomethylpyrimidine kinase [Candidatus Atribacteria bacterium]|nr:bifunctional hydroxymethylpyrimidine kinase/phosphomethylpyrimidine kinase [Candidatus Atribacteria bacterium]